MLHPSTKKLIDRLCEMTIQRKIDWVSSEKPDTLAYNTEGYRVLLEGKPATLVLCDALGNELDRATQDELIATNHIDGGSYDGVIETMRADAARIARGTEDAIASVLGGLDLDGDGIPDIPAPIALEDAPDGPVAQLDDDIEDTADEMGALEPSVDDTDLEAMPIGDNTANTETAAIPQSAPDIMAAPDVIPDVVPDAIAEAMPEMVAETTPDLVQSFDAPDVSPPKEFDNAANIGQAVADLADEVNLNEAATVFKAEEPAPSNAGLTGGLIGTAAFGVVSRGLANKASVRQETPVTTPENTTEPNTPNAATAQPTTAKDTTEFQETTEQFVEDVDVKMDTPPMPNIEKVAPTAFAASTAGETYSLSGLSSKPVPEAEITPDLEAPETIKPFTDGDSAELADINTLTDANNTWLAEEIEVPTSAAAELAPAPQITQNHEVQSREQVLPPEPETQQESEFQHTQDIQQEFTPPPQVEASDDLAPPAAPEAPEDGEHTSEEPKAKPANKRFNPWI